MRKNLIESVARHIRVRVRVRVLNSRFITRLVLRSSHPRPSRREVTRTPNSHKFNKSKFRSGSNKSLVCCYGVIIPTELLHLRHGLSLLIGIHQPPLVGVRVRVRVRVRVSWVSGYKKPNN